MASSANSTNSSPMQPGFCLIIRVGDHDSTSVLDAVSDAGIDVRRVVELFGRLNYKVVSKDGASGKEVLRILLDVSGGSFEKFSAFVCFLIGRGVKDAIFGEGIGGAEKSLKEAASVFNADNCPTLRSKPKIFVHYTKAMNSQDEFDSLKDSWEIEETTETKKSLTDFLFCHSVTYFSFASVYLRPGTVFVQTLCDLIDNGRNKSIGLVFNELKMRLGSYRHWRIFIRVENRLSRDFQFGRLSN